MDLNYFKIELICCVYFQLDLKLFIMSFGAHVASALATTATISNSSQNILNENFFLHQHQQQQHQQRHFGQQQAGFHTQRAFNTSLSVSLASSPSASSSITPSSTPDEPAGLLGKSNRLLINSFHTHTHTH